MRCTHPHKELWPGVRYRPTACTEQSSCTQSDSTVACVSVSLDGVQNKYACTTPEGGFYIDTGGTVKGQGRPSPLLIFVTRRDL